jgi:hypothetical protein
MEVLGGKALEDFPLVGLRKVAHLIYFEGPLLSVFQHPEGDYYLYYWCDTNDDVNRWLVFPVGSDDLESYLNKKTSLRDLILNSKNGSLLVADIDRELRYTKSYSLTIGNLPESYIPAEDSLWEEDFVWETVRGSFVADLRKKVFGPSALDRFRGFLREAFFYQLALPASAFDTKQPVDIESEDGAFGVYIEEDKDNVITVRLDSKEAELAGKRIRLYISPGNWERVFTLERDTVDSEWVYLKLEITGEERKQMPKGATLRADVVE